MYLKKILPFILCAAGALASLPAHAGGQAATDSAREMVFFNGTYAQALAEAKRQNKYLFVDCYTTWCGPCKAMTNNVFPTPEAAAFYNRHYVNYKVDMEKGEGPALSKKFGVRAYPTMVFLKPSGELAHKIVGQVGVANLNMEGRLALDDKTSFYGQLSTFRAGKIKDTAALRPLVLQAYSVDQDALEELSHAYFKAIPYDQIIDERVYPYFHDLVNDVNGPVFKYVADNEDKFVAKYGAQAQTNLDQKVFTYLERTGQAGREADFMKALEYVEKAESRKLNPMPAGSAAGMRVSYYTFNKDFAKLDKATQAFLKKYGDNEKVLREFANRYMQINQNNPVALRNFERELVKNYKKNPSSFSAALIGGLNKQLNNTAETEKWKKEVAARGAKEGKTEFEIQQMLGGF